LLFPGRVKRQNNITDHWKKPSDKCYKGTIYCRAGFPDRKAAVPDVREYQDRSLVLSAVFREDHQEVAQVYSASGEAARDPVRYPEFGQGLVVLFCSQKLLV
jgi:hypothetical protein